MTREVDTMDTFMDSSWYFLRFLDPKNTEKPFDPAIVKQWMPVDIYVGGMEHAIMHLLYARFIHKVLCDQNQITDARLREPFNELIVQGLVKGKTYKT
jgi:leucyl-tRNA synthetase